VSLILSLIFFLVAYWLSNWAAQKFVFAG